jgi:IclR family acetate operon transcriptional repressor
LLENRLEPRTPHTIIKPQALREELRRIRERGYSFDNEEMEEGVICIAAPIFDRSGQAVAAISISGPGSRLKDGHISEAIEPVVAAATEVSGRLGYKN